MSTSRPLRPADANGHDCDTDDEDEQPELLRLVRGIDERLGHSPDYATGYEGSGLCRTVAELKSESDFRARQRAERSARAERWKSRAQFGYAAVGVLTAVSAIALGAVKLLLMFLK